MTVEERIGAADRRKMDGNALFKEEKLEEAMQQYAMVTHLRSLNVARFIFVFLALEFPWFHFLNFHFDQSSVFWMSGHNIYG